MRLVSYIYEWGMSHIWMRHVTHVWMRHVTRMNETQVIVTFYCVTKHARARVRSRSFASLSLSLSLSRSLALSLSLSRARAHARALILSQNLSHTDTLSLSFSFSFFLSLSLSLSLSLCRLDADRQRKTNRMKRTEKDLTEKDWTEKTRFHMWYIYTHYTWYVYTYWHIWHINLSLYRKRLNLAQHTHFIDKFRVLSPEGENKKKGETKKKETLQQHTRKPLSNTLISPLNSEWYFLWSEGANKKKGKKKKKTLSNTLLWTLTSELSPLFRNGRNGITVGVVIFWGAGEGERELFWITKILYIKRNTSTVEFLCIQYNCERRRFVRHESCTCVPWNIQMRVTWRIHRCAVTDSYACDD